MMKKIRRNVMSKKKKTIIVLSIIIGVVLFNTICFFGYKAMRDHQIEVYKAGIRGNVEEFIKNDGYFKATYGEVSFVIFPDDAVYEESKDEFKITVGSIVKVENGKRYHVTVYVTSDDNVFQYEYAAIVQLPVIN